MFPVVMFLELGVASFVFLPEQISAFSDIELLVSSQCSLYLTSIYPPGIYAEGYIAFALTFVRSYVRSLVSSCVRSFVTFRHVRRIYHKVFG